MDMTETEGAMWALELADQADRLMRLTHMAADCSGNYEPSRVAYAQTRHAVAKVREAFPFQQAVRTASLPANKEVSIER